MNDDDLLQSLRALGRPDTAAPAAELSRVRRSIRRRRRLRVGATASASTLALAAVAIGVVVSRPAGHVAQVRPVRPAPTTAAPTTGPTTAPTPPLSTPPHTNATATAATPAAPDLFADIPERGPGSGAGPLPEEAAIVLRSATDGHLVRVFLGSSEGVSNATAEVGPSGRYVYYAQQSSDASGTVHFYRKPVAGGPAVALTAPAVGVGISLPVVSDDDSELAWSSASSALGDAVYITDATGGHVRDLGPLAAGSAASVPVGWSPDGATLYVSTSVPIGADTQQQISPLTVTVRAVTVEDPGTPRTVFSATSASRGDDGACGVPGGAATVTTSGLLVVVTSGCSTLDPNLVTEVDTTSGRIERSLRLPAAFDGSAAAGVVATSAGSIVISLEHQDCYTSLPVALVRGAAVTRPAFDDELCGTGP